VRGQRRIESVGVDHLNGVAYWTDSSVLTIKRARIPSSASQLPYVQDLQVEGLVAPKGIAFDWLGR
jgi:hypothetical protein